ncbi:hypothetical protein XELAEV_18019007mg [Xenopus laevis]|uniref:Ribonucleoprotein PTB-binding 1 n=1 Tax=Xenopus laevis TaxID=8355 RepID=A0A974HU77_XENLA|nr:hypothetical protein XELAEV_18019007mg [Xenopus laevis]
MAAALSVRTRTGGGGQMVGSRGLRSERESVESEEQTEVKLEPQEIRSRVERMRREVRNRRKILIKGLPGDITNQEVHDLLGEFELKYCFVDKYKGTAFVTLLNGEQAESAIRRFHQIHIREREISVQLQPTDALLCIANLPPTYTQQQFEDLVRPFGNLERCFLVYSSTTGCPKGYGFVEYMKKDSASRAKSDLLGRQLGSRTLYVHWSDVNQLTYELLHSHCLLVEQLQECDIGELREAFSKITAPSFCQLAYGQDNQYKGFAIVEYESEAVTEMVQQQMDGSSVAGSKVRVSFCAPGPAGRSMLAALIAAQAMALNRGNGLLPEPNILQILSSLGSPATLQLLLNPLLNGAAGIKQGLLGAAPALPLLANPALSTALLQLVLQAQTPQSRLLNLCCFLQMSLLGDPPRDVNIHSAPYGNYPSQLPSTGTMGPPSKPAPFKHKNLGTRNSNASLQDSLLTPTDGYSFDYPELPPHRYSQNRDHIVPSLGSYESQNKISPPSRFRERSNSLPAPLPPFSAGSPSSYFTSGLQAGLKQTYLNKAVGMPPSSPGGVPLEIEELSPPSGNVFKTPIGAQKRGFSHLIPSPEPSPEGGYIGQHSQGLGGHYADSYLKRKRIF